MAFHKYAKTTISPNLNTIKNKWSLAKNWDGKYDFNVLTSVKTPHAFSSENLRIQLGAFLYDVAEGCKSTYKSGGHAFIIDGYYNMTCTATNGSNIITITDNFIHCNTGWGGSRNGYYLSGVMNFGMGPLTNDNADRSIEGTSYYYQYKLSQTNILKPKVM